jgi:hypothetical protein
LNAYVVEDPNSTCTTPLLTVTGQAAWGLDVVNYSSYQTSNDWLYMTVTREGVETTSKALVRLSWGVATHITIDPIAGLDGPPVYHFCRYNPPGTEETPDPVVTLRQSPPPPAY